MNAITIHEMTADHAGAVQALILELADFEKCPNEVKTNENELIVNLLDGVFAGKVALSPNREVIGMVLYFPYYSTWNGRTLYLEDFYVKPAWRSQGVGRLLFEAYLQTARDMGAKMVKWQVLDWNEGAKNFYKRYGARFYPGWENSTIRLNP
jgi:GNAT superfamily N-acetyltransferase